MRKAEPADTPPEQHLHPHLGAAFESDGFERNPDFDRSANPI
jgi:hypothetical protein